MPNQSRDKVRHWILNAITTYQKSNTAETGIIHVIHSDEMHSSNHNQSDKVQCSFTESCLTKRKGKLRSQELIRPVRLDQLQSQDSFQQIRSQHFAAVLWDRNRNRNFSLCETGFKPGSNIKCNTKVKIKNKRL